MTTNYLIRRLVKQNDAHRSATVHSNSLSWESERTHWFNKSILNKPVVQRSVTPEDRTGLRREKLRKLFDFEQTEFEKELNQYGLGIRPSA